MIIGKPKIEQQDDYITVSSDITIESDNSLSTTIWYRFPQAEAEFISDRSDAFLVGIFFLAMKLGEDIVVEGKVSPKIAYNLKQVQQYFHAWLPNILRVVRVNCKNLTEDFGKKQAIISSFSGGVDAFYTLVSHLGQTPGRDRITHALFIGGFDVLPDDPYTPSAKKHYATLLKGVGVKLLTADTNLKAYLDPQVTQAKTFGAILASAFLALSKKIARVYIPSAYQYRDLLPYPGAMAIADGSNPVTDHLFSTETTKIFHFDPAISRIEKTAVIAQWPLTYNSLRVCWAPQGLKNCSQCSKCFRTMLELKLCNSLEKYQKSFPLPFTKKIWFAAGKDQGFIKELRHHAFITGRWLLALQMQYIIIKPILDKYSPWHRLLLPLFYGLSYRLEQHSPHYVALVRSIKKTLNMDYQDYPPRKK